MAECADGISVVSLGRALLVTLPDAMQDGALDALVTAIGERIAETAAAKVVIDASNTRFIDSFMGRALGGIAGMSRLLGAETTMVGLRPEVAITLVELGLELRGISTALTIELALSGSAGNT